MPSPQDGRWICQAVDRFEGPLTLYAARLLGGDVERARDVVQDTFLRLWESDQASVNGHLAQWLYRVCRNRALDVRRKESRMTTLIAQSEVSDQKSEVRGQRSEVRGQRSEVGAVAMNLTSDFRPLTSVMQSLPEKQQEVLRLKFQGGLSYADIATVMDITVNHVGVLIHSAIKALRERMEARDQKSEVRDQKSIVSR